MKWPLENSYGAYRGERWPDLSGNSRILIDSLLSGKVADNGDQTRWSIARR